MRTIIVTGASRGIGHEIAKESIRRNMKVHAFFRHKNDEAVEALELEKKNAKGDYCIDYVDITKYEDVKKTVKKIIDEEKTIDILVNNAGVSQVSSFLMTPIDRIKEVMEINFFSQILLTQLVVKSMIRNKKGTIINISSSTGLYPQTGALSYGSSKAALIYAGGVMADELGQYGIRVNTVCPGFIDTDMWSKRDSELIEERKTKTALGRMGSVDEVAKAVFFLADEEASFITGSVLSVDGGMRRL